jgi:alpha-beta hydrolase superfamily lysophospholipase
MPEMDPLPFSRPPADDVEIRYEPLTLLDGHSTLVVRHVPRGAAAGKCPVVYVHGIQSHPGWFIGSAQALARAGHEVFQITRRGSGRWAGRRGDARGADQLLDDVAASVEYAREQTSATQVALVGVSWGGKLLTAYVLANPPGVAALALVAPGLAALVDVSPMTKIAIALCRAFHRKRMFDIPLSDVALFTDNPAMRQYLEADALRLRQATARFLFTSAMLDRMIARSPARAMKIPTTLILARRERIVDNARTAAIVSRLTGGAAKVVELDGAHTLEFESDPRPYYEALCRAVE